MAQRDAALLRQYMQNERGESPEAIEQAAQAKRALDDVLFELAQKGDAPETYRAYLNTEDIDKLQAEKARLLHDRALLRLAMAANGEASLEKAATAFFDRDKFGSEALSEACGRRLSAIAGALEGQEATAYVKRCGEVTKEPVHTAHALLRYSSGVDAYEKGAYERLVVDGELEKQGPAALKEPGHVWLRGKEVERLLKSEENTSLLAARIKGDGALPQRDALKARHDDLIAPCGPSQGWQCKRADKDAKESWLQGASNYISACLACVDKAAVEKQKVKVLAALVKGARADCKRTQSAGSKECKATERSAKSECGIELKNAKNKRIPNSCADSKGACNIAIRIMASKGYGRMENNCGSNYNSCIAPLKAQTARCQREATEEQRQCTADVNGEASQCTVRVQNIGKSDFEMCVSLCSDTQTSRAAECKRQLSAAKKSCSVEKNADLKSCRQTKNDCNRTNNSQVSRHLRSEGYGVRKDCSGNFKGCTSGVKESYGSCVEEAAGDCGSEGSMCKKSCSN
jgi:hypothetical protein